MHTSKTHHRQTLAVTVVLLTALVTGCGSSSNDDPVEDSTPLTITSTNPNSDATAVATNSSIIVTFSEAMNADTLNTDNFTVKGAGETTLMGAVSLNAASNTATFNPSSTFTPSTVYTATISTDVESTTDKSLTNDYVWTFTSGATPDTTPPTVSSTNPLDAATGFALNRSISVVFNESLDPATVNTTNFTLTADAGDTSITATTQYVDKMITLSPSSNLTASTLYTATLTTAIKDLSGNALATNYVWTFTTGSAVATGPSPVNLLTAGNFVILTKTGITNVHTSAITGNIGASPITAAANDNVFCSEITGTIFGSDAAYTGSGDVSCFAGAAPDNTLVANAVLDMGTAYNDAAGRTIPDFTELHAGDVSGQTLVPGLYKWGTNLLINTDVTLSGGANDVWIFQIAGDVIQASNTSVILTGGALAKNIFWQVGGGTGVALDTNATFAGVVLATKGITVNTGTVVNGRLLSQTAVTLDMNTITKPAP